MMIKSLYHWTRTLIKSRRLSTKPSWLPSTKHLEHHTLKTNNAIRTFMNERVKQSDIINACKARRDTIVLVSAMKGDHIAINAFCLVKGKHNGDFISLKQIRHQGNSGLVLYHGNVYTTDGLARKMSNWSVQGNNVEYGYYELSPFASFTIPLTETEMMWVRESIRQDHIQILNRGVYTERYA